MLDELQESLIIQMTQANHFRALERMYLAAPINEFFAPTIKVAEGTAEIAVPVKQALFHAAGAVHGSTYFKVLDDAAFFAANSLEPEVFVLTTAFTTYLTRPVSSGTIAAVGKVVSSNKTQFICESVATDSDGREIGRGSGIFVRSKIELTNALGYASGK